MNIINRFIVLAVVGAAVLSAANLAAGENVPGIVNDGGRWSRDVDGKEMVCFYNSVLKVGDTFYLYGEWRSLASSDAAFGPDSSVPRPKW